MPFRTCLLVAPIVSASSGSRRFLEAMTATVAGPRPMPARPERRRR